MDELKQTDEWSRALRRISRQRDRLLESEPAISPARRAALGVVLAREFPGKAALQETTARRDQLLVDFPREVPCSLARDLRRRLTSDRRSEGRGWPWPNLLTRPLLAAACLIVGLGVVLFGKWEILPSHRRHELLAQRPIERTSQPPASRNHLSLRMSAPELTALRATFLAANRASLNEDPAAPTRLRLDLPVRALLGDDGIASTP